MAMINLPTLMNLKGTDISEKKKNFKRKTAKIYRKLNVKKICLFITRFLSDFELARYQTRFIKKCNNRSLNDSCNQGELKCQKCLKKINK